MTLRVSDFSLPEQLDEYRAALKGFIAGEGAALAEEMEAINAVPDTLFSLFREAGLFRLALPCAYGGLGLSPTQYAPLLEEVAHASGAIRLLVHLHNWVSAGALIRHGTEEQRRRYLPALARGEGLIAFALTEPESGSGTDIRTRARREGDTYYLNGRKHLVSYADLARAIQVVAYTDPAKRAAGISLFLVGRDNPGATLTAQADGLGMRGGYHGVLDLTEAPVASDDRIGAEGEGLAIALDMLDTSRAYIAISCVGLAQELLDRSAEFARRRVTFGKPIAERQVIQTLLADMSTEVAVARAYTMATLARLEQGRSITADAARAKLFGLQMVGRVSDWALEIHGGLGYLKALPIERHYRDARALWFEEGTATMQRLAIARDVLGD